jgi:arylsulfatase A-like enzyme
MPRPDSLHPARRRAHAPTGAPPLGASDRGRQWVRASVLGCGLALLAACSRGTPSGAPAEGSSVLVTLLDAGAPRRSSAYGFERPTTPFLETLVAEGTRFEDASAAAPYTLASVASLFTGLSADAHRVLEAGDTLPDDVPTLAESFQAAGYATFGLSSNAHIHKRFGFDRGFEPFEFHHARLDTTPHHAVPDRLWASLLAQLDRVAAERTIPFFGYVHLMPPHAPYDPPEEFRLRLAPEAEDARLGSMDHLTPLTVGLRQASAAEAERIARLYDAGFAYADAQLARLEAELLARNLTSDLVWVVLSDHGEAFGEHGLFQHSGRVDEEMLRSLWVWRLPKAARRGSLRAGGSVERPVSTAALGATLMELVGVDPLATRGPRRRLPSVLSIAGAAAPVVARTAGPGPTTSYRDGAWKLVHYAQSGRRELFDLRSDPGETRDLADREPERVEALQSALAAYRRVERPGDGGRRVTLTPELREELEALGYRWSSGSPTEDLPDAPEPDRDRSGSAAGTAPPNSGDGS